MRVSERWLRDWIDTDVGFEALAERLTMAGLEVAGVEEQGGGFEGVVTGRVLEVARHPDADKLSLCKVDAGNGETLEIVCGAPNVRADMAVAVAVVGARVGDIEIRRAELRGVESQGMLCSARELGLGEEHDGILDLGEIDSLGQPLGEALGLPDRVMEIELTPNRGDCLSMLGVAREAGVLTGVEVTPPDTAAVPAVADARFPVRIDHPEGCPRFGGRVISGIDPGATTPTWMVERLRRAGVRSIHPVVDITNYVMLEFGNPMHAYDLRQLDGRIVVRMAKSGERLLLLDGREIELQDDVLVIADDARLLGLAGIMGGEDTGVRDDTIDIFLECAYFDPLTVAGRARRFGLHTDASHRFERGVDPWLQQRAIERATALVLEICGGGAGPTELHGDDTRLPSRPPVILRRERLSLILGLELEDRTVSDILARLELAPECTSEGWQVAPPGHRFDIEREEDLVEEVARIHGYEAIPEQSSAAGLGLRSVPEDRLYLDRLADLLVDRGYREAITYSFVKPETQRAVCGDQAAYALANPISSDLSEMRLSLWPGLLTALRDNQDRQAERVRLFESGLRYIPQHDDLIQEKMLSAVAWGPVQAPGWDGDVRNADLFDIKGDLEALIELSGRPSDWSFQRGEHPALHPGQTAQVLHCEEPVGWVGAIHPRVAQVLDVPDETVMFEVSVAALLEARIPAYQAISRFPSIRRDLAVLVPEGVSGGSLLASLRSASGALLRDAWIFDVYRGKGIEPGLKSVALSLILQDSSRTLTDEDADDVVARAMTSLEQEHQAQIRD